MFRLIFILILLSRGILKGETDALQVHFKESYPSYRIASDEDAQEMRLHKRDMQQFFDKASYSFNGVLTVASVPVPFPLDICILQLPTIKYATALHKDPTGVRQFAIYVWRVREQDYVLQHQHATPKAVALDCLTYAGLGYVALSFNHTEPVDQAAEGSPIYELTADRGIRTVQYFADQGLRGMYLRISSQELTLLQSYEGGAKQQQRCPYFKWTGRTFRRLGAIPCSNARRLEAFGIDYADYVAVANYASPNGRTATHSEIYKYDANSKSFQLFQRLRSNGAVDVKYFSLPVNEVSKRHFLILGNTVPTGGAVAGEADTVIYVYDKGQFVPYQRLSFDSLERFLPVTHVTAEKFLLFVACRKQDMKIYNLNDWKFEESTVQFTEGAFSRGVARLRSYEENDQSYLVVANENMAANETNIFQPLYKQDEHANVLRQQVMEWAREQTKRLENLNVQHLLQGLKHKVNERQVKAQVMNIKRVNAKTFVDVPMKLTSNYWDALQYAKRAVDVIEEEATQSHQPQHVKRAAGRLPRDQHQFEEITVDTLIVQDQLRAGRINGLDTASPVYQSVNATKVLVSEEYTEAAGQAAPEPTLDVLKVDDLQLRGKLNGLDWGRLTEQTLKRRGSEVQFIKAAVSINNLKSTTVHVNSNEINDRPLGQLISIDGGDYVVQQDVQFAQPIDVNKLLINQRLNHIHVDRQRFDVLLRQANYTQLIEGTKRFENLRVLEPIQVAVQMNSDELRAVSPMKVTHQSLELQGDYEIDADITIGRLLQVQDLREATNQRSAAVILKQALRVNQQLEDVNLHFNQLSSVNDSLLSFINAQDLQQLVQLNVDEVQVVEGTKWLPQSLTIRNGFGEINILNGIHVDKLSEQLLLKSSNQTIRYPVQLSTLSAPQLNATHLLLNGLQLQDYMRYSGDQQATSNLYVEQLLVDQLEAKQLHMHGTLFGRTLEELYEQGAQRSRNWQPPSDFNGTIDARNIWLKGQLNNVDVGQLEQQLQQLAGNIKYVGDVTFRDAVNISELTFGGSLNGIQANRLGKCWLESSGDQEFTAPQTLAALASEQNVKLYGNLNNYTMEQLLNGCYRLNESEQLQTVRFVNPITLQQPITVGHVNGLRVPEDMLYAEGGGMLQAPLQISGQLVSSGTCNVTQLNGFNLESLTNYLMHNTNVDTLHVEQAKFQAAPSYEKLNGHQLEQILDDLWLDNEYVELRGVQLASSSFEGLMEFKGTINGLDVNHIEGKYFSRTRSQQLNVPLCFEHDVTFVQPPTAKQVQLRVKDGALMEAIGNVSLNFDDFVKNTLKTSGAHIVTGHWSLEDAHVNGDLRNILINQLNLVDDVLRNDSKEIQSIDGLKIVDKATVKKLYATPGSTVANVPIFQWINNTVYVYGNHSIAGITRLESVNMYNDLQVKGTVNGIPWQPNELLISDQNQQVAGQLIVDNTLSSKQRILSHNIKDLWVDRINGHSVNELLENKALNRPNLHLEGQLIFKQPLTVANYELSDVATAEGGSKWKRGASRNAVKGWQEMEQHVAAVQQRLTEKHFVLESFELLQHLPLNASHMELLDEDILAIWHTDAEGQHVATLKWQPKERIFSHNPIDSKSLHPHEKSAVAKLLPNLTQVAANSSFKIPHKLQSLDCLAYHDIGRQLSTDCLNKNSSQPSTGYVKQLQTLDNGSLLGLLVPNGVEIWQWKNRNYSMQQLLEVKQPDYIALAKQGQHVYLAVLKSFPAVELQIYRSEKSSLDFELTQEIGLDETEQSRQLSFMHLHQSKDLLLCLSNATPTQPLRIYQQRGVAGFQQIMGDSILPSAHLLKILELPGARDQLMALANKSGVYLVAPKFTAL